MAGRARSRSRAALALAFKRPILGRSKEGCDDRCAATRPRHRTPDRPVRLIVPGPAAGAGDVVSRITADRLQRALGQPVVIENRPGATTNLGMQAVARAPADGYTLGVASAASHGANRWLFRALPFDPVADFVPISLMAVVPNLMVVPIALPATSIREFIDYVKARPEQVNYGSIGPGSSQHLAGVQFDLLAGTRMVHVPYSQSSQMNTDLMEGRVQVLFQSVSSVAELVRAGRMRALACSGAERLPAFPDVPTLREQGVDITTQGWFGWSRRPASRSRSSPGCIRRRWRACATRKPPPGWCRAAHCPARKPARNSPASWLNRRRCSARWCAPAARR